MNQYTVDLRTRNKARILTAEIDSVKRVTLLAAQDVVSRIGDNQLEMAVQLIFETALLFYLTGNYDGLYAMGIIATKTSSREGNA